MQPQSLKQLRDRANKILAVDENGNKIPDVVENNSIVDELSAQGININPTLGKFLSFMFSGSNFPMPAEFKKSTPALPPAQQRQSVKAPPALSVPANGAGQYTSGTSSAWSKGDWLRVFLLTDLIIFGLVYYFFLRK